MLVEVENPPTVDAIGLLLRTLLRIGSYNRCI